MKTENYLATGIGSTLGATAGFLLPASQTDDGWSVMAGLLIATAGAIVGQKTPHRGVAAAMVTGGLAFLAVAAGRRYALGGKGNVVMAAAGRVPVDSLLEAGPAFAVGRPPTRRRAT